MITKIQPKIFKDVSPTINENVAAGYSIGTVWHNNITGHEYIHSLDGIWNSNDTSSFQTKTDNSFNTTNKTVSGAINELLSDIGGKQPNLGFTPENIANKGQNNGYAGLDSTGKVEQNIDASKINSGTIDINRIPKTAIERLVIVANQAARYALTINDIQNGDTVKQTDTGVMYFVKDDTNLSNSNGYEAYSASIAGAVEWNNVLNKPSTYNPSSHNHLNDTVKPNVVEYQSGATIPTNIGSQYYDDTYKVLSTVLGNGVILQNGLEMYVRVVNKTGVQLNDGQAVYISGAQGNRPTASLAIATSESASYVIGVCTENIANNQEGFVTVFGTVNGIDTSGFSDGAKLYLSATVAGGLTTTRPAAPNHGVIVGIALNSTNNGSIFVNPNSGFELSELHDVNVSIDKLVPTNSDYILLQDTSASNIWKKVSKLNLNEVHVGASAPVNNESLWVDTSSSSNNSYIDSTSSTISPNFAYDYNKFNSNYASGSSVSISGFTNMPLFDCEKDICIKNTKGSDMVFVPTTTPLTVGSITYNFILMNTSTITVPSGKHLELSYGFRQYNSTTFNVLVIYTIQG